MSALRTLLGKAESLWQATLWLLAALGLALGTGPALAAVALSLAALAAWKPARPTALLGVAALRGIGLSIWALQPQLPLLPVLVVAAAAVVALLWRDRQALGWVAAAAVCLVLPWVMAQSGGWGTRPTLSLLLRVVGALLLCAEVLSTQWRRPSLGWRSSWGLAGLMVVGVGLRLLDLAPVLPAPRYATAPFEAARLGQQQRVAKQLDAAICEHLQRGERLPAEGLLRWGVLLAPSRYQTAEGRLWRAEQLYLRDPVQARAIVRRARRASARDQLLAAARRADTAFVRQLVDWWSVDQPELARELRSVASAPAIAKDQRCVGLTP